MLFRGLLFAIGLAAGAGAALAFAQGDQVMPVCPDRLAAGTHGLQCLCPSEATATGSVWGSDVYTDDSAICRAALHAGVISTDGGTVYVVEAAGQASYPAVTRNSVASAAWPSWGRSIAFHNVSEVTNADRIATVAACPANAAGLAVGTRIQCGCSAAASADGPVWGSAPIPPTAPFATLPATPDEPPAMAMRPSSSSSPPASKAIRRARGTASRRVPGALSAGASTFRTLARVFSSQMESTDDSENAENKRKLDLFPVQSDRERV